MNESHCAILLSNFPLGIRIKFENRLKKYQQTLNINNISYNSHPEVNKFPTIVCNTDKTADKVKITLGHQIFHLQKILTNNTKGSLILDYYKKHNIINESCRNILVEIIINDIINNDLPMNIKLANFIADAIVNVFPSEIKISILSWYHFQIYLDNY